jgi:hypothetical protein
MCPALDAGLLAAAQPSRYAKMLLVRVVLFGLSSNNADTRNALPKSAEQDESARHQALAEAAG